MTAPYTVNGAQLLRDSQPVAVTTHPDLAWALALVLNCGQVLFTPGEVSTVDMDQAATVLWGRGNSDAR